MPRSYSPFSLVELIIVIALIAFIVGMVPQIVLHINERPRSRFRCKGNQMRLMQDIHQFEVAQGKLPPGCLGAGDSPENQLSWMVVSSPHRDRGNPKQPFDLKKGYKENLKAAEETLWFDLKCSQPKKPSIPGSITNYVALSGIGLESATRPAGTPGNGFMGYHRTTTLAMIADGLSNTIALTETRSNVGPWARGGPSTLRGFDPADLPLFGDDRPFGAHPGERFILPKGMNVAFADGSVHYLRHTVDPARLAAAITIAGSEQESLDNDIYKP